MTSTDLEADIRSSQKIKDDWTLEGSVSNTMAAYISYPQDMSDHTFSVYVNRPGLSFGYFFRGGGTLSGIQRGIVEFTVEGYNERALSALRLCVWLFDNRYIQLSCGDQCFMLAFGTVQWEVFKNCIFSYSYPCFRAADWTQYPFLYHYFAPFCNE